jgi:hypothetical protein
VQTLMDAGLTPVHGKASHMDTSDPPQTVLQSLHNDNVSAQIPAWAQPLPAIWRDRGPVESAQSDWMESAKNVPDGTASKKNPVHHFKSYGELDDYDRLRRSANEHWRTMQYYFDEAAAAYGRGERCRAAALSEKGKEYKQLAREASDRASYRIFDSKYVRSCFGCHCEVVVGAWLIIWVLLSLCGAFLNVLSSFAIWSDLPTEGSLLIN